VFYRGPERDYNDKALSRWLRTVFFNGQSLLEIYGRSLAEGVFVLLVTLFFAARAGKTRGLFEREAFTAARCWTRIACPGGSRPLRELTLVELNRFLQYAVPLASPRQKARDLRAM